jgi:signal transduction histidine kinase
VLQRNAALLTVAVVGLVSTAAAVRALHAPAGDVASLLGLAAAGSLVAAVLGTALLRLLRRRTVRTQAVAIAGVALAATVAGVVVAALAMFLSSHDLRAMLVVLPVSGSVALGAAVQMGRQIERATQGVVDLARRLPTAEDLDDLGPRPVAGPELDRVAEEVAFLPSRLAELRARSDALERSRRELVAWVSHDLRGPLATIRAMAEALDDGVVTEADSLERYHRQIRRDAERLSALVDDLFELSRIHSGALVVQREEVSVQRLVRDALATSSHRAEAKGVRLVEHVDPSLRVLASASELTRVLQNLLDNAVRHTPPGGKVVVTAEVVDGTALVLVEDECGGIPEPDIERVFDVAFRGDAARSRDAGGGGLGLTIAKGLVEACAGEIEVVNAEAGCRFTVALPSPGR